MSLDTRLRRAELSLTAAEHAYRLLEQWRAGQPGDIAVWSCPGVPAGESETVRILLEKVLMLHEAFITWQAIYQRLIVEASLLLAHAEDLIAWQQHGDDVSAGSHKNPRTAVPMSAPRGWIETQMPALLLKPRERRTVDGSLGDRPNQLLALVADEVAGRWREQRAMETALAELAPSYAGGDIAHPQLRDAIRAHKEGLVSLQARLRVVGTDVTLPEPETADLQLCRRFAEGMPSWPIYTIPSGAP